MLEKHTGSCLCNALRYHFEGGVVTVVNCHCNICKKSTGAAFETIVVVNEQFLEIDAGKEELKVYRVSDKATKHFCGNCGTPIYNSHIDYPGFSMVHVGSLDRPYQQTPSANFFCERMLPWVKEISELENFDRLRTG